MKEPTYVLPSGTVVQIHATLEDPRGKKPGMIGTIKGTVPNLGGSIYDVDHGGTTAQYGFWEFEIPEAVPLADRLDINAYTSKVSFKTPKKRLVDQSTLDQTFLSDLVADFGMQDHPKGHSAAVWCLSEISSRLNQSEYSSAGNDEYIKLLSAVFSGTVALYVRLLPLIRLSTSYKVCPRA